MVKERRDEQEGPAARSAHRGVEGLLPERGPRGLWLSHFGALETACSFSLKRFLIIILGEIRAAKNGADGRTAFLK